MSNVALLFLPLAFSSLPAVLPFVSPSSQVREKEIERDRESGEIFFMIAEPSELLHWKSHGEK